MVETGSVKLVLSGISKMKKNKMLVRKMLNN